MGLIVLLRSKGAKNVHLLRRKGPVFFPTFGFKGGLLVFWPSQSKSNLAENAVEFVKLTKSRPPRL